MIFEQRIKTKQQHINNQANIKMLALGGNWTLDVSHPSLECYLSGTESTERIDWSQAI